MKVKASDEGDVGEGDALRVNYSFFLYRPNDCLLAERKKVGQAQVKTCSNHIVAKDIFLFKKVDVQSKIKRVTP